GNVLFEMTAKGAPPLFYQWTLFGTNLVNATNSYLFLAAVGPTNSGIYAVTISNSVGMVTSSNAVLTVNLPPPVITTQPPAQKIVMSGYTFSLTVQASGATPLNYQWKFNGTNLVNATNNVLTLTNVQPAQNGIYAVTISNVVGWAVSSNTSVAVINSNITSF